MNILILLITQNVGGVEKRFYNYCNYILKKSDQKYTVFVSRSLISTLGDIEPVAGNRVVKYGFVWKKKGKIARYVDYLLLLFAIGRMIHIKFDAIHYVTGSSLFFHRLFRSRQKVFSCVDSRVKMQDSVFTSALFKKIMDLNFAIDCLDKNIRNRVLYYFPEKAKNIHVSACTFINYKNTECNIKDKTPTICFAGRLEEFKGIHLLLNILPDIIDKTDFSVIIMGKGSYRKSIEDVIDKHQLSNRVEVNYSPDLISVLKKSSVFLSIQKEENYPSQSLVEAMACKNAIIATNVGLTTDIIKSEFGVLIPFCEKELLKSIIKLSENQEALHNMGSQAREFAMTNHNIEKFHNYLIGIYTEGGATCGR